MSDEAKRNESSERSLRRRFRRRDARALTTGYRGPNMTPMVDVTMVILIFFMASTAFIAPELLLGAQMVRPQTPAATGVDRPPLRLEAPTIILRLNPTEDGSVTVIGLGLTAGTLDDLANAARTLAREIGSESETLVVIEPSDAVTYDAVVRAQAVLARAGIGRVAIR